MVNRRGFFRLVAGLFAGGVGGVRVCRNASLSEPGVVQRARYTVFYDRETGVYRTYWVHWLN